MAKKKQVVVAAPGVATHLGKILTFNGNQVKIVNTK